LDRCNAAITVHKPSALCSQLSVASTAVPSEAGSLEDQDSLDEQRSVQARNLGRQKEGLFATIMEEGPPEPAPGDLAHVRGQLACTDELARTILAEMPVQSVMFDLYCSRDWAWELLKRNDFLPDDVIENETNRRVLEEAELDGIPIRATALRTSWVTVVPYDFSYMDDQATITFQVGGRRVQVHRVSNEYAWLCNPGESGTFDATNQTAPENDINFSNVAPTEGAASRSFLCLADLLQASATCHVADKTYETKRARSRSLTSGGRRTVT
jgi:hypothetical protein